MHMYDMFCFDAGSIYKVPSVLIKIVDACYNSMFYLYVVYLMTILVTIMLNDGW